MEDKSFKKIMMHSKVETSEGFTDELLQKLASRKAKQSVLRQLPLQPALWGLLISGLVTLVILYVTPMNSVYFPEVLILHKTPLVIGLIFLCLTGMNHLLRLAQEAKSYHQIVKS